MGWKNLRLSMKFAGGFGLVLSLLLVNMVRVLP